MHSHTNILCFSRSDISLYEPKLFMLQYECGLKQIAEKVLYKINFILIRCIIIIIIIINIIIIIIIIIIIMISFMQGIYTYIPETNHVSREYMAPLQLH